ncbi:hypothetical protein [Profundibacter sp.]
MSDQEQSPSVLKIGLFLYPFTMAAVAVNLYMLSLAWQRIGLPVIPPATAVLISLVLCIPANWWAARWVRGLFDEAAD